MTTMRLQSACAWVAFVTIVLGVLASTSSAFRDHPVSGDLTSPILAVELMRMPSELAGVLGPPEDPRRVAMTRLTRTDLVFIAAYASLFVLVGLLLIKQGRFWVALLLIVTGLCGAILDVLEDLDIFRLINGGSITPRHWSIPKWTLLFLALGFVSFVYRTFGEPPLRRVIGYVAALLSVTAALIGLCGVILRLDPLIESGGKFLGLSLVAGWLFFATQYSLRAGLCVALDRLTEIHPFRLLARWPSDEVKDEPGYVRLFQYGSNMNPERLNAADRLDGRAQLRGTARLNGWGVRFDLFSTRNNCAVTDIVRAPGEYVLGAVYEVPVELVIARKGRRSKMDEIEGAKPNGRGNYEAKHITIREPNGEIDAITYMGTEQGRLRFNSEPSANRQVSAAYFAHLQEGAARLALQPEYVDYLTTQATSLKQ